MQEYQAVRNNPHKLPEAIYRRTVNTIRCYSIRKEQLERLNNGVDASLFVKFKSGKGATRGTEFRGMARAMIAQEMEAIDDALLIVPTEYRKAVLSSIEHPRTKNATPHAHRNTISRWRSRFIHRVAVNTGLIFEDMENTEEL